MGRLLGLKEWVSIGEAETYLSGKAGEKITKTDIYRFALNRNICLSVNFVNQVKVRKGHFISKDKAKTIRVAYEEGDLFSPVFPIAREGEKLFKITKDNGAVDVTGNVVYREERIGLTWDGENYLEFDDSIWSIEGIYDLFMRGNEKIQIEQYLMETLDGPEVDGCYLEGAFVKDPKSNIIYQVMDKFDEEEIEEQKTWHKKRGSKCQESESYFPASGIPEENSLFVIRTEEVDRFLRSLNSTIHEPKVIPQDIIEQERKLGKSDKEVAAIVDSEWTGNNRLSNKELGQLFAKNEYVTASAHEQRGKRLRGKKT